MPSREPVIIVALDFPTAKAALALARHLDPGQCRVKVGMELFTAAGPAVVRTLQKAGFEVFLDLKFHDIPHTVARACGQAVDLGVWMINVHALGGPRMLAAARTAVTGTTRLIGVTVLTSHDEEELRRIGLGESAAHVQQLAALCAHEGLDGVVCSAREAQGLRAAHPRPFVLVTPGIRPEGAAADDQRRVAGIGEALAAGADYLVIGRPIIAAADPPTALASCVRQTY
ncbi:MAG: orotidine-5'-phosphate decarboxylase [Acidiferrobacter sp.]